MKTKLQKLIRRLDRGYLRLTNLIRPIPLGYLEHAGTIHAQDGGLVLTGWHFDGLGRTTALDMTGSSIRICGYDTGIMMGPVRLEGCIIESRKAVETTSKP